MHRRVEEEALGGGDFLDVVSRGRETPVFGLAVLVNGELGHELGAGGVGVDAVDRALDGVQRVAIGDVRAGALLGEADAALAQLPVDLVEPAASLAKGSRHDDAHDGRVAGHAHNAELDLARVFVSLIVMVVVAINLELVVDSDVGADEGDEHALRNLHRTDRRVGTGDRLGGGIGIAHEAVAGDEQTAQVDIL